MAGGQGLREGGRGRPGWGRGPVIVRNLGTHAWVWAEEWVTGPESRVTEVAWLWPGPCKEGGGGRLWLRCRVGVGAGPWEVERARGTTGTHGDWWGCEREIHAPVGS